MSTTLTPPLPPTSPPLRSDEVEAGGHERIVMLSRRDIGLQAVVAIHSTVLGPALGGLRFRPYPGGIDEALHDARRLSSGMTLKASAAGLDLGGGKAVLVDDGRDDLREARLVALAREIERLAGSYITAEDVGTTVADMDLIARHTRYVVGRSPGASGVAGDPSPATARTVLGGARAALTVLDGDGEVRGRTVGVVGLGKVGGRLARWLAEAGADVIAYDPAPIGWADVVGVRRVALEELLAARLDVLAPCALGGLVDAGLAGRLQARAVCGAANNQLASRDAARILHERGILYVPDFLANSGGLIHADAERRGADADEVSRRLADAERRTLDILREARTTGGDPQTVASEHALARIESALASGARHIA